MSAATITERSAIGRSHPLNRCLSPRLIACATPRARSRIALSGLRLTPGGYVAEHADEYCPTAMPGANQLDLSEHIWRLFADDAVVEGSSMRTQDFGPQGLQVSRSRGWLWERLNRKFLPSS